MSALAEPRKATIALSGTTRFRRAEVQNSFRRDIFKYLMCAVVFSRGSCSMSRRRSIHVVISNVFLNVDVEKAC